MNKAQFWNIDNVSTFRGFNVVDGEVTLSDDEYTDHIDETHDLVFICDISMSQGAILKAMDPIAFSSGKSDYESSIQSELEEQLENEDGDDIVFIDGEVEEFDDEMEDEE